MGLVLGREISEILWHESFYLSGIVSAQWCA